MRAILLRMPAPTACPSARSKVTGIAAAYAAAIFLDEKERKQYDGGKLKYRFICVHNYFISDSYDEYQEKTPREEYYGKP